MAEKNSNLYEFTKGIIKQNPTLVTLLGMCPTLAVTTMAKNGIGMGLGFTIALTLLGAVREFLGTGKIFDLTIMPEEYGMLVFVLAPGAFIALGYLIALINSFKKA